MIQIHDGMIEIHTQDTSYIMYAGKEGLLQNYYYGGRIQVGDGAAIATKEDAGYGGDVLRHSGERALSSLCLELSPVGRGDYRKGALLARMAHGGSTSDYQYQTSVVKQGSAAPSGGMPMAHGAQETLCVSFSEPSGLAVELYYTVFEAANVITRKMRIINQSAQAVCLQRCMSMQLDLPYCDMDLHTLQGAWAREAMVEKFRLAPGTVQIGNGTGASGNKCNPFFFLARHDATEHNGDVYGFNLVYSGSHEASVEVDSHGRTRVMQGIWSDAFDWKLEPGEAFVTPEAVLTFSDQGKNGMSRNMHLFVQNHIVPEQWQNVPRPVLVNNWEGTYFNFNEAKLMGMAKIASKLGVELFVLDDGWFGARNNDKAGLGDYNVNRKKLPSGLHGLANKINRLGMQFGLWVEPEMVNADSDLYRAHPDWIIQTPGYAPCTGRQQYVLDLCREEVQQYLIDSVNTVLDSANIQYIKWDMNRHISDNYSPESADKGGFMHRYMLGLYKVLDGICRVHPEVLFEGCSSGGNRTDLGILSYMPQVWISDDTDAVMRTKIQTGISYGYPPSIMGCHVSAVPNHQTLRNTPLDTRFNVAMFGLLGYELDMRHLNSQQRKDVAEQITYYKQHRRLLQYGRFVRLVSPFTADSCRWMVLSEDGEEAIVGDYTTLMVPNSAVPPMRLRELQMDKLYTIEVRPQNFNIKSFGGLVNFISPVHINPDGVIVSIADKVMRLPTEKETYKAYGSALCKAGLKRQQIFSGAGYNEKMRILGDFGSRVYYLHTEE